MIVPTSPKYGFHYGSRSLSSSFDYNHGSPLSPQFELGSALCFSTHSPSLAADDGDGEGDSKIGSSPDHAASPIMSRGIKRSSFQLEDGRRSVEAKKARTLSAISMGQRQNAWFRMMRSPSSTLTRNRSHSTGSLHAPLTTLATPTRISLLFAAI